jgi:hypothetical protein
MTSLDRLRYEKNEIEYEYSYSIFRRTYSEIVLKMSDYDDYDEDIHVDQEYSYEDEAEFEDEFDRPEDDGEEEYYSADEDTSIDERFAPPPMDRDDPGRIVIPQGVGTIEGKKALRNPRDVSLERCRGVLSDPAYVKFHKDSKDRAYRMIEELPEDRMILYNIETLTAACLFLSVYPKGLNRKNIEEFLRTSNDLVNVNHLDFIRYLRALSH